MRTILNRIANVVRDLKLLGTIKDTDYIYFSYEIGKNAYKITIVPGARLSWELRVDTIEFCFQNEFGDKIYDITLFYGGYGEKEKFDCYILVD